MFQEIRLRGLGVIDDAVLELGPGLNVLTGETGAGKTMVVSGLGLLLGGRADSGLVRTGDSMATVEGTIELPAGHPALVRAQDAGGDTDDGLVLLRSVSSEGRSRAHVGGRSAPVGTLAQIGRLLVAVHGQADQWRLRSSAQHREILDDFGGPPLREALTAYLRCFDDWETTRAEALRLRALATASRRDAELLRAGLEYIEAVHPQPGEDLTLRVEDERLAHADGLRTSALQAQALLAGGDDAAESPAGYGAPGGSVRELLSAARGAVAGMSVHDPALRELDGRLAELGYLVADLSADLAHYGAQVEVDPARLAWVQQRRSELASLVRRYGDSVDDVLDWARESAARFEELAGAGERAELLEIEATALRAELARRAATLSQARSAAAAELSTRITGELSQLAMTSAAVHVAVRQRPDPEGLSVGGEPVRATRTGID
ncbi:MAG TPA: AAA family ATPase, partial [Candidatus Lustribacter sp.]|nr:AAA family ATPase [Candidatus Lustribacter sp.]